MAWINRKDVVFLNFFLRFSVRDIPVLNAKKQAKIQFLWCLNCFYEFSVFLVSILNDKKSVEVTENCIHSKFFYI